MRFPGMAGAGWYQSGHGDSTGSAAGLRFVERDPDPIVALQVDANLHRPEGSPPIRFAGDARRADRRCHNRTARMASYGRQRHVRQAHFDPTPSCSIRSGRARARIRSWRAVTASCQLQHCLATPGPAASTEVLEIDAAYSRLPGCPRGARGSPDTKMDALAEGDMFIFPDARRRDDRDQGNWAGSRFAPPTTTRRGHRL